MRKHNDASTSPIDRRTPFVALRTARQESARLIIQFAAQNLHRQDRYRDLNLGRCLGLMYDLTTGKTFSPQTIFILRQSFPKNDTRR